MKKLKIFDPTFLPIIFPEYLISPRPLVARKVIYTAVTSYDVYYEETYVLVNSGADLELVSRADVINYVVLRRGGPKPGKSLLNRMLSLEGSLFKRELLWYMALGKWKDFVGCEHKVYNLFEVLVESKLSFFRLYFSLREDYSFEELWSSVLTFFCRVVSEQNVGLSDYYMKVIESFRPQIDKIRAIKNLFLLGSFNELIGLDFMAGIRG